MRVIDLTHTITQDMPVFPGTDQPSIRGYATVPTDGFRECMITLDSHTGTHMDSPAHAIADGDTLDLLPAEQFLGKATIVDCRDVAPGDEIGLEHVEDLGSVAEEADFLVFRTGWGERWDTDGYFGGYPLLSDELIDALVAGGWKGIGLDAPSVDSIDAMTKHRRLLGIRNIVIVENLCNLGSCPEGLFWLGCFPLRYAGADGSPVRALAWEE
ncbi:MAG: cyclase family protein [Olsenella sp.]|nr:cyclase family protein [Olsenella sp.]